MIVFYFTFFPDKIKPCCETIHTMSDAKVLLKYLLEKVSYKDLREK